MNHSHSLYDPELDSPPVPTELDLAAARMTKVVRQFGFTVEEVVQGLRAFSRSYRIDLTPEVPMNCHNSQGTPPMNDFNVNPHSDTADHPQVDEEANAAERTSEDEEHIAESKASHETVLVVSRPGTVVEGELIRPQP